MLDENHHLIQFILDYQSKGKTVSAPSTSRPCTGTWSTGPRYRTPTRKCSPCCTAAHPEQDAGALPDGGLFRSCADQGPHFRGSLIDATAACLTPSSLTQAQTDIGPNHVFTRQTARSALPSASRSASGSSLGLGARLQPLGTGLAERTVCRAKAPLATTCLGRTSTCSPTQAASACYRWVRGGSPHYAGQSMAMMAGAGRGAARWGSGPQGATGPPGKAPPRVPVPGGEQLWRAVRPPPGHLGAHEPDRPPPRDHTAITPTSWHPTPSRATTGRLRSPRSTTTTAVRPAGPRAAGPDVYGLYGSGGRALCPHLPVC